MADRETTGRDDAEALGFMSAAEGKQPEACPYPDEHPHRGAWLVGWTLARACGAFIVTVRKPTAEDRADLMALLEADDAR